MNDFVVSYRKALVNYADFRTRTSVGDYWRFFAVNFVIAFVLGLLAQASTFFWVIYIVYTLALLIPGLAAGARRLHDTGKTGWLMLLLLIPLIGFIILIVFWVQASDGPNRWGAGPT